MTPFPTGAPHSKDITIYPHVTAICTPDYLKNQLLQSTDKSYEMYLTQKDNDYFVILCKLHEKACSLLAAPLNTFTTETKA